MPNGYFRELRQYNISEIAHTLNIHNIDRVRALIGKLRQLSVLKAVPRRKEEYIKIDDTNEFIGDENGNSDIVYVFNYVGIIVVGEYVIKCYPKYIRASEEPEREFKTILRVIQKINSENVSLNLSNGEDVSSQNGIELRLYILNEFYQRGLYINERESVEDNGEGEILWDETLEEPSCFIDNQVFHIPLKTLLVEDDEDYFTNLHKCILSQITRELEANGVSSFFDLIPVYFTTISLGEFDNLNHILYMLQKEKRGQYVTWKQILLQALYAYVNISNTKKVNDRFELYGTNHFHVIWEKVCKSNFGDRLDTLLRLLPNNLSDFYAYKRNYKLKDIIEKPVWYSVQDNACAEAQKTYEPDLIGVYAYKEQQRYEFWIFDAKYYYFTFEKNKKTGEYFISGQPGVEDITKQYMYELVFRSFVEKQEYIMMHNIFLIPTEELTHYYGNARINVLEQFNDNKLKSIDVVKLDADKMYKVFLSGKKAYDIINYLRDFKQNQIRCLDYKEGEELDLSTKVAETTK